MGSWKIKRTKRTGGKNFTNLQNRFTFLMIHRGLPRAQNLSQPQREKRNCSLILAGVFFYQPLEDTENLETGKSSAICYEFTQLTGISAVSLKYPQFILFFSTLARNILCRFIYILPRSYYPDFVGFSMKKLRNYQGL